MNLKKYMVILASLAILSTACAGAVQESGSPAGTTPDKKVDATQPVMPAKDEDTDLVGPGIRSPLDPLPNESTMVPGEVILGSTDIILLESFPVQVHLKVKGDLPTPCHFLRAEVSQPDAENRIDVKLYTLTEQDVMCIQVIQPFEDTIPLGDYSSGSYQLFVNGDLVSEFKI